MIRGLIFDLDGTLVDSLPGITAALNHALEDLDLPTHSQEVVSRFVGDGVENLVRRALQPDHLENQAKVLDRFQNHYPRDWKTGTHPYPGIMNLLEKLSSLGMPTAVLSNKPHSYTVEIVETVFPQHLFETVRGHLPGSPRKPDPTTALEIVTGWKLRPNEVAYVGDSTVDLGTARAAGLIPLIFSWGYGTPNDFPLLHSTDDLERALS
ncbi:MAG: HAD family hydrolase [Akkermansiaceae bacterium]